MSDKNSPEQPLSDDDRDKLFSSVTKHLQKQNPTSPPLAASPLENEINAHLSESREVQTQEYDQKIDVVALSIQERIAQTLSSVPEFTAQLARLYLGQKAGAMNEASRYGVPFTRGKFLYLWNEYDDSIVNVVERHWWLKRKKLSPDKNKDDIVKDFMDNQRKDPSEKINPEDWDDVISVSYYNGQPDDWSAGPSSLVYSDATQTDFSYAGSDGKRIGLTEEDNIEIMNGLGTKVDSRLVIEKTGQFIEDLKEGR